MGRSARDGSAKCNPVWEPCVPKMEKKEKLPKKVADEEHLTAKPTFYKHCNYGGYAIGLTRSTKWVVNDGIKNDDLSALKVPQRYSVTIYQHRDFKGAHKTFKSGSHSCLVHHKMAGRISWNDHISSIRISKIQPEPSSAEEGLGPLQDPAEDQLKRALKRGWGRFKKMKKVHRKGWGKLKNWGKKMTKKVKGGWGRFKKKVKKAIKRKSRVWNMKGWRGIKRQVKKVMKTVKVTRGWGRFKMMKVRDGTRGRKHKHRRHRHVRDGGRGRYIERKSKARARYMERKSKGT